MSYEVRLEQFNGPLKKLLELIEARELDVSRVSLASVTGDFIHYVEGLGESADSLVLSDFVAVAAKLLLIKSKVLLPGLEFSEEEEADIAELEKRLGIYRAICSMNLSQMGADMSAALHIHNLWNQKKIRYSKKFLASLREGGVFYPPQRIGPESLAGAMRQIVSVLERILPSREEVQDSMVTLQEKIEELVGRLSESSRFSLNGSFKEEDKQEIVVLFLAVLHMLANRLAEVEQTEDFGEIWIRANGVVNE